jgi:hypothetical protein
MNRKRCLEIIRAHMSGQEATASEFADMEAKYGSEVTDAIAYYRVHIAKPDNRPTNEELLKVANYYVGGCLCGHFESCSVCSRSQATRQFEDLAKQTAVELLRVRGVELEKKTAGLWSGTEYRIKE